MGLNIEDEKIIDANPTKELFISMLVRDITLVDAIGDLIDNCVDGALALHTDKNYSGLYINVILNSERFIIQDNCGGIPYDTAKNYAFRFGRTSTTPSINGSVGQFGIGMKRALFKIGKEFCITSTSQRSKFTIDVSVDEWEEDPNWNFLFKDYTILTSDQEDFPESQRGTKIIITKLTKDTKEKFNLNSFVKDLENEIEMEHLVNIDHGLDIIINNTNIKSRQLLIINSVNFTPGYWEHEFESGLFVKAIVGISDHHLQYGGWYIFCNERMILGPEQTIISGWGAEKPTSIPKYHGQYDRFRGYVYFFADDTNLLPWNTAKNNMDIDSPTYSFVRQNMIALMRPVIDFLNKLHKESQKGEHVEKPLENILANSSKDTTEISKVILQRKELPAVFKYPSPPAPQKSKSDVLVSYYFNKEKILRAMTLLHASSYKEVGEKSFEYFYTNECEE